MKLSLSWDLENSTVFVAAINALNPAHVPYWLQTSQPQITANSFTDDLVYKLHQVAGGQCGRVLLAPNSPTQFGLVMATLVIIQNSDFIQDVAQVALPMVNNVERVVATTYYLTDKRAQRSILNNLPVCDPDNRQLRRIFI
ncbi:hypothetical protein THRCLA_20630 [Thraustotheca clavata]|uniref:Uncharacterized protein n=1 Tax=Thraustotheca clavata TaxID=74557 RepID=A0A1W0A548_9STRA|nr:hypothetical protein THRCLA_20630 [Thraustotheca clavata]